MNIKQFYKQILTEDLGSPELMANIEADREARGIDPTHTLSNIAFSRHLFIVDPKDPKRIRPMKVNGAMLSPDLIQSLVSAAQHGVGIPKEHVATIRDFIRQHGHFVAGHDDSWPDTVRTDDPRSVLGNIFGSTRRRKR